jgi:DNA-binding CsgD family transcriptional regulator
MTYNGISTAKYIEPPLKKGNSYNSRFCHWYSQIADLRIREPAISNREVALRLGKHENTIAMIVSTDLFKEYFHQRREEFRKDHDFALRAKLTDAATQGLDIILDQLKTKKTAIPLQTALKVTESALDRLGYAPSSGPEVVVNNNLDARHQTVSIAGLSATELEEARQALRRVEQTRVGSSLASGGHVPTLEQGAGQDVSDVVEAQVEEAP